MTNFIQNAQKIIDAIPNVNFGLYECPYPYKRLLSKEVINWCISTGRFTFLKDTCCDNKLLKERNSCLKENMDLSYLEVLTNNLAEIADYLINKRIEFIEILENNHQPIFNKLYGDDKIKISIKIQI